MQNQRMLQARHRYLQARRDLEYKLLKEADAKKLEVVPDVVPIADKPPMTMMACLKCGKVCKNKAGLSAHMRFKNCEEK